MCLDEPVGLETEPEPERGGVPPFFISPGGINDGYPVAVNEGGGYPYFSNEGWAVNERGVPYFLKSCWVLLSRKGEQDELRSKSFLKFLLTRTRPYAIVCAMLDTEQH